jgi:hypothetical protein
MGIEDPQFPHSLRGTFLRVTSYEYMPLESLPKDYPRFLHDLKERIRAARLKVTLSANRELVILYWDLGRRVIEQQKRGRWGTGVIAQISRDLRTEFPEMKGFSVQNLWRIRAFYLAWTAKSSILSRAASELPPPLADIPWSHNNILIMKLKDPQIRLWYARKTVEPLKLFRPLYRMVAWISNRGLTEGITHDILTRSEAGLSRPLRCSLLRGDDVSGGMVLHSRGTPAGARTVSGIAGGGPRTPEKIVRYIANKPVGTLFPKTLYRIEDAAHKIYAFKSRNERFFNFMMNDRRIIITNAYRKHSQKMGKTDLDKLKIATAYRADYLHRVANGTYYENEA